MKSTHAADDSVDYDDLVDFFATAERPDPRTHLVGTELEKFGVVLAPADRPLRPVEYHAHILPVLEALCAEHGWSRGSDKGERGELVDLHRDGASITLEPGGQLELSGKPLPDVHATCAEFSQHHRELDDVSGALGLTWFACGFHPWATRAEIDWMPKGRYRVMRQYLPTRGAKALDMMLRTCTIQANFDYTGEAQAGQRLRVASAIAPFVAAIFANSPFEEGRRARAVSVRNLVWTDVDPDRCGVPAFVFDEGFSYQKYVDWALDVPMFFVKRDDVYHAHHATFREFLRDGVRTPDGMRHHATWTDWTTHLSTLFPEVRLKPYIEVRSADAVSSKYVCALPALLKGILYDDDALMESWELVADLDLAERKALWIEAATAGLHAPRIQAIAQTLIDLARASLDRQDVRDAKGRTESRFLDRLQELVEQGRCPADEALGALGDTCGRDPAAQHAFVGTFHFAGPLS